MTVVRRIFAALAWLYLAAVLFQFYLAGVGLAQLGGEGMGAHGEFGYIAVHLTPVLLIAGAVGSRSGRRLIGLTVLLAVVAFMQPIWVTEFRGGLLASMHILGAGALLVLSYQVARLATAKSRAEAPI